MALAIKKIYIDSRHRTDDSRSSSSFKIQLPTSYVMPPNTVFFITDVCIPHIWRTVEKDMNDTFYYSTTDLLGNLTYYARRVTPNNYTYATLLTELQRVFALDFPTWSSSFELSGRSLVFNNPSNAQVPVAFTFYSIKDIPTNVSWTGDEISGLTNSISETLGIFDTIFIGATLSTTFSPIKLQAIDNVYITSPNFGHFETIAPFSNNVIKKVPINNGYGFMIVDQFIAPNDYLDCSGQTLNTLEFNLRTGNGYYVNLNGYYITFSIVFNKYSED